MSGPTPYPELNRVLETMVRRIRDELGGNFIGAYLQGSFAVGDFDDNSDVDFIVVLREDFDEETAAKLSDLHEAVYNLDSEWAKHLEGSYFPAALARDGKRAGEPVWYLDHGSIELVRSNHCNTLLVRWVVREKGVTLAGPPPKSLIDPISKQDLREEIYAVIIEWGQEILDAPEKYANHFYQAFILQSYCRMLHDLIRGQPGSKRAGTEWAKRVLDTRWHDLIDRSWAGRIDPARSVRRPADAQDYEQTLQFVRDVMQASRKVMAWNPLPYGG